MDPNLEIDPALLREFIDESEEMLSTVDRLFVELESDPEDLGTIEAIFRPVHSIKGNSSFFGFARVKVLAHELETLLDLMRKKTLSVTPELVDILLEGVDELKAILGRARNDEPEIIDEGAFDELVGRVKAEATREGASIETILPGLLEQMERIRSVLTPQSEEVENDFNEVLEKLRRIVPDQTEASSGGAGGRVPEAFSRIQDLLADTIEDLFDEEQYSEVLSCLRNLQNDALTDKAREAAGELVDTCETFINSVGFDALLQDIVLEKLATVADSSHWKSAQEEESSLEIDGPSSDGPQKVKKAARKNGEENLKTMRVSEQHIDIFLNFVGELLVVGDMFGHLEMRMQGSQFGRDIVASFRQANETFVTLSNELQRSIMSIRKVPVRTLLQKVPRMVRDIATVSKKEIVVELTGESLEIDKSLVDMLDAPLTHMVRNAADHGIESPEDREAAGKPRAGHILISVLEEGNNIVLSVEDDGKGLDFEAIRKKAVSLGLVSESEQSNSEAVIELLFASGVTTATEVTDVSGRGVGMDVVKRMIEEAGGTISVTSEEGTGSVFLVQLPKTVTTQIMQGFVVRLGDQSYVLPLNRVHEASRIETSSVHTIVGKTECIERHGEILPLVSMRAALGFSPRNGTGGWETLVTVMSRKRKVALSVDHLLGVQQVVLRQIDGLETQSQAIAGGALMGDGSIALVVDLDGMFDDLEPARLVSNG